MSGAGGLMQLVAEGEQNVYFTGDPDVTLFKSGYHRYGNFALQKFPVIYEGTESLRMSEPSTFTFKIKRYAELLVDTYLAVDLPNIWSPIYPPQYDETTMQYTPWVPYEFKWIDYIGAKMITKIRICCGNYTLQEFSGDYLLAAVQRDFSAEQKEKFYEMIGHVPELVDPGNAGARVNAYPNVYYTDSSVGPEPSIRARTIFVPLNTWFGLDSHQAFPLISLQYNELRIEVTLRPINQLYQIRDVTDATSNYPYVAPNINTFYAQFYRFLQPPPDIALTQLSYTNTKTSWASNIHLVSTYAFLSEEEQRIFALQEQKYLIKQVHEYSFYNVTGPNRVSLQSLGFVSNWLFYFQRSDANLRNEWSNYTNWPYNYLPADVEPASTTGLWPIIKTDPSGNQVTVYIGPGVNPNGQLTGLYTNPEYTPENEKQILVSLGILLNGEYRENTQPAGVFNLIEKYTRTSGSAPDGLYCYNFALHADNARLNPSGGINMNQFNRIELEFVTINPPLDPLAQSMVICDPETGLVVGINKPTWRIYDYNFNLYLAEERLNFVIFGNGNCGLAFAT